MIKELTSDEKLVKEIKEALIVLMTAQHGVVYAIAKLTELLHKHESPTVTLVTASVGEE
jgi:hypothetical protein